MLLEPGLSLVHRAGFQMTDTLAPLLLTPNQSRIFEDAQMLRRGRKTDRERLSERADCFRPTAQILQHSAPRWICERAKCLVQSIVIFNHTDEYT